MALYIKNEPVHSAGAEDVLNELFQYSKGKDLQVMDGAGDYPLHAIVQKNATSLARFVIYYNPPLMHRENAMDLTPLDVVSTSYLRSRMDNPPQIREPSGYYARKTTSYSILARPQSDFIKTLDQKEREDQYADCNMEDV